MKVLILIQKKDLVNFVIQLVKNVQVQIKLIVLKNVMKTDTLKEVNVFLKKVILKII